MCAQLPSLYILNISDFHEYIMSSSNPEASVWRTLLQEWTHWECAVEATVQNYLSHSKGQQMIHILLDHFFSILPILYIL